MKQAFVTTLTVFALLGCNAAPVRFVEYEDQQIMRASNRAISKEEVQIDMRMAAGKAGWSVTPNELPGRMVATKTDGKASATVEITFNLNKYSIRYKDSTNLDYLNGCADKTSGGAGKVGGKCISPTYNEWVTELNGEISKRMQY